MDEEETKQKTREIYLRFSNEIAQKVKRNLRNVDEEGFAFLSNAKKHSSAPIEYAKGYGLIQPIFITKKAFDKYGKELETHESWWVRDEYKYKE